MASRKRDHKAEYQRRLARAKQLGYSSEREYKKARKELAIPRRQKTPPKRDYTNIITSRTNRDKASQAWSKRHSKVVESRWDDDFTEEERANYYSAYTHPSKNRAKWRQAHHDFLVPRFYNEEEYDDRYKGGSSDNSSE